MRYAKIDEYEVSNGIGNGMSLYVQGCRFRCPGCQNPSAWDFNGGKEWTKEVKDNFIKLIDRLYITRVSVLGGEPLADENLDDVYWLLHEIKRNYPDKKIWLYTGYTWEHIMSYESDLKNAKEELEKIKNNPCGLKYYKEATFNYSPSKFVLRKEIVSMVDVLVDGLYEDDKRDLTLKFKGSRNQRIWRKNGTEWIIEEDKHE